MNQISQRFLLFIAELINRKSVKDAKGFAQAIGIGPSTLTEISKKRTNVGLSVVEKSAVHFPELNLDWLIRGEGTMFHKTRITSSGPAYPENGMTSYVRNESPDYTCLEEAAIHSYPLVDMENLGKFAAGKAEPNGWIPMSDAFRLSPESVSVVIDTDAMTETLPQTTLLFIRKLDKNTPLTEGQPYIVTTRNGNSFPCRLKKVFDKKEGFQISFDSPDKVRFPDMVWSAKDIVRFWDVERIVTSRITFPGSEKLDEMLEKIDLLIGNKPEKV